MTSQYTSLTNKLNSFIKKFYKNRLIKGLILTTSLYLFLILLAAISEYFAFFNITTRTIIFYALISVGVLIFIEFIGLPFLKLLNLGKTITYKNASHIISKHFTEIQDKLFNILELAEQKNQNNNNTLVLASIDQKISQINYFSFKEVIQFKKNIKYLKYLIIPLLIFIYLLFFRQNVLSNGTERIINHRTYYEKAQPFNYTLLNDSLTVRKGDDFQLHVRIKGTYIPSEVTINYHGNSYLLKTKEKYSKNEFLYTFKNINNSLEFHLSADNINSKLYKINVLPPPVILDFKINVDVPKYTGHQNFSFSNVGDITVPYGSTVSWDFKTKDIDSLNLILSDSIELKSVENNSHFILNKRFLKTTDYELIVSNSFFKNEKLVKYKINVIPDLYPEISVEHIKDSVVYSQYYFQGLINDDYGFSKLTFNYYLPENKSDIKVLNPYLKIQIPISNIKSNQEFYYFMDFSEIISEPGQKIKYFFEITDNDYISNYKTTRSQIFEYKIPTLEELAEDTKKSNKNIQSKLNKAADLSEEIKKDINLFKQKSLNQKMTNWEKTNFMEQLAQKQQTLQQLINEVQNQNKQKNNQLNSYESQQEDILKKQEEIQELLDELFTEEMKEMLEEIQKLQEEFNNKEFEEMLNKMEYNYDELSEQLDRDLELLKQMEVTEEVNSTIEQMKQLSEEQKELSEQSKDKKSDKNKISEEQKENSQKFDDLMEEYKKTQEKNSELENPMKLDDFEKQQNEIQENFQQSSEMLEQSKMKKASKSQQSTSENLEKMANQMESMMDANMEQSNSENIEELKQIQSNLLQFSFSQEELYTQTKNSFVNSPKYRALKTEQINLKSDFKVIKDSLLALSKRNPTINKPVLDEISSINRNIDNALENMENKKNTSATNNQRRVITSANNLTLLMNEILNQMKQQQQDGSCKNGKCKKPGQGTPKPSFSDLKKQQQGLQQQLQQMLDQMKGQKKGNQPGDKNLAKTLAQQEMFQQMLNEMMNGSQFAPQTSKQLNQIKSLNEKTKKEIINNQITPETLLRQNQILTRLLEAENSENERKFEKRRESKEATNKQKVNPEEIMKKFNNYKSFSESLNKTSLKLNNFYKQKHNSYLNELNN